MPAIVDNQCPSVHIDIWCMGVQKQLYVVELSVFGIFDHYGTLSLVLYMIFGQHVGRVRPLENDTAL